MDPIPACRPAARIRDGHQAMRCRPDHGLSDWSAPPAGRGARTRAGPEDPARHLAAQLRRSRSQERLDDGRSERLLQEPRLVALRLGLVCRRRRHILCLRILGAPERAPARLSAPSAARRPTRGPRRRSVPGGTGHAGAAAVTSAAVRAAMSERGARRRVHATGVGAPFSLSTVTIASPVPSDVSAFSRS